MDKVVELYVIKDIVADDCGPVYQAQNEGVAKRQYKHLMQQNKITDLHEYELWRVGYLTDKMELIPELRMIECYNEFGIKKMEVVHE